MRKLLAVIVPLLLIFLITSGGWYYSKFHTVKNTALKATIPALDSAGEKKLLHHISFLKQYSLTKKYNTDIAFVIDMNIESGKKRFFVIDLKSDSVIDAGLVTHGRCNRNWLSGRKYSNEVGSGCSSLGLYKIGTAYKGRFGLAYKLHGLDATNSNAYQRFVVLHSMECVPEAEVFPYPICQSDGCPTVSPGFLKKLQVLLNSSSNPVLLYLYE
jgi:hypothetical protein